MKLMDKRHEGSEPDWHLVAMVAASERGTRASFNGADGISDIEGKAVTGSGERAWDASEFQLRIGKCNG
jgi:hypothetical protein